MERDPIVDGLLVVRDTVEEARTATNVDAQQSALRRAHAAVSSVERTYYAKVIEVVAQRDAARAQTSSSWRTRRVVLSEFDLYGLYFSILVLLAIAVIGDHQFAIPAVFLAVLVILNLVRTRLQVRRHYRASI